MNCRHCRSPLKQTFVDLGFAPPSNAYIDEAGLQSPELYYPLKVMVCEQCWLVQTHDYNQPEDFFNQSYAYFSSTSSSWLEHARVFTNKISEQLDLSNQSFVIEVASNDGYLLKNFVAAGIPCLGIEPTESTAAIAEANGVPVLKQFFTVALAEELAQSGRYADLIIGNNVYAHVPDINDFTRAMQLILKPEGTITLEFPHLLNLLCFHQFDTIYHEHFSYLSLSAVNRVFSACGLRIYDVQQIPTHGGSLRVYGCKAGASHVTVATVGEIISQEADEGLENLATYGQFQQKVDDIKACLLEFLLEKKRKGRKVAAYGAAAKGNTLLNYAGVKPDLLPFVCDAADAKQGKYMPGSHIPILAPEALNEFKPDYVLVLPWNIADEIKSQYQDLIAAKTEFVCAIPELRTL